MGTGATDMASILIGCEIDPSPILNWTLFVCRPVAAGARTTTPTCPSSVTARDPCGKFARSFAQYGPAPLMGAICEAFSSSTDEARLLTSPARLLAP
jgi:hypothetical protein